MSFGYKSKLILCSEHDECLSNITFNSFLLDSQSVESDSLGDRSALTDGNDITNSSSGESRGKMSGHVLMSLLESVVLLNVVEVISSEDNSSAHLIGEDDTFEDSASDGNWGSERTLVIDVLSGHCLLGSLET